MLAGGGGRSGESSSSVARDSYETDSMDNPVTVEIGASEGGNTISRTLHSSSDEDFFLLVPDRDGRLVIETIGDRDLYMDLYRAGSQESIASDDDDGDGANPQIRYNVEAGGRYIAKVRGYSGDTGRYGFRAYIIEQVRQTPDEYEDDNEFSAARDISIGTPQQHSFTDGDDIDWVKFRVSQAGRYTIRAAGVNSNRLDTYIELYDSSHNLIDEDDDGGSNYDSRLSVNLQAGTYYLSVKSLDDEPAQPYTISIDTD
jgi:hypothetical protein